MSSSSSPSSEKVGGVRLDPTPERTSGSNEINCVDVKSGLAGSENYGPPPSSGSDKVNEDNDPPWKGEAAAEHEVCMPSSTASAKRTEDGENALNPEAQAEDMSNTVSTMETASKPKKRRSKGGQAGKTVACSTNPMPRRSERLKLRRSSTAEEVEADDEASNRSIACYVCELECSKKLWIRCKRCDVVAHWDPMFCCLRYRLLSDGTSFVCPKCAGVNSLTNSEAPVEDLSGPIDQRERCVACGTKLLTSASEISRTVYCSRDCIARLCDAARKEVDVSGLPHIPMVEPILRGKSVHGSKAPSHRRLFSWIIRHPTFRPVYWFRSFDPIAVSTSTPPSIETDKPFQEASDSSLPTLTAITRCFACSKVVAPEENVLTCRNCGKVIHGNGSGWSCGRFSIYNEHYVCPQCNTVNVLTGASSPARSPFDVQLVCTRCTFCGEPLAPDLVGTSVYCQPKCVTSTVEEVNRIILKSHRRVIPMIEPFPGGKLLTSASCAPRSWELFTFLEKNRTFFPLLLLVACNSEWTLRCPSGQPPELGSPSSQTSKGNPTAISSEPESSLPFGEKGTAKCAKSGSQGRSPKESRDVFERSQESAAISPSNESAACEGTAGFIEVLPATAGRDHISEVQTKDFGTNSGTVASMEIVRPIEASPTVPDGDRACEVQTEDSVINTDSVTSVEAADFIASSPVVQGSAQTREDSVKEKDVDSSEQDLASEGRSAHDSSSTGGKDEDVRNETGKIEPPAAREPNALAQITIRAASGSSVGRSAEAPAAEEKIGDPQAMDLNAPSVTERTVRTRTRKRKAPPEEPVVSPDTVESPAAELRGRIPSKICSSENKCQSYPDDLSSTDGASGSTPLESSLVSEMSSRSEKSSPAQLEWKASSPKAKRNCTAVRERQEKERGPLEREEVAASKRRRPASANRRLRSSAAGVPKNKWSNATKSSSNSSRDAPAGELRTQLASKHKAKPSKMATPTSGADISPALAIIEEFERKQADAIKAKQGVQSSEAGETEHANHSNGTIADIRPNRLSEHTGEVGLRGRRRPSRWDVGDPCCRGAPNKLALVPALGMAEPLCKLLPEMLMFEKACQKGPLLENYLQSCFDCGKFTIAVARFEEPLSTEQARYRRRFQYLKELDCHLVAIAGQGPPYFNVCAVALGAEESLPPCLNNLVGPGLPYLRRNAILLYVLVLDQSEMVGRPIFVSSQESYANDSSTNGHGLNGEQDTINSSGSSLAYIQTAVAMVPTGCPPPLTRSIAVSTARPGEVPSTVSNSSSGFDPLVETPGAGSLVPNQFAQPPPLPVPPVPGNPVNFVVPMQMHLPPPPPSVQNLPVVTCLPQPPPPLRPPISAPLVSSDLSRVACAPNASPMSWMPPYPPPPLPYPPNVPNSTFSVPPRPH